MTGSWLYEVYDSRGARQRGTMDPKRAVEHARNINGFATRTPIWHDARLFRCPQCDTVALWTDGQSMAAGDDRDEFWCQHCGTETPLTAVEVVDEVPA